MGVESNFFILPDTSGYRPEPDRICELVRVLRAEGFLCDPKSPTFSVAAHPARELSSQPGYEGFYWRLVRGTERHAGPLSALRDLLKERQESDLRIVWP